ncbi:LysR family transcriptional regulator [Verticiella sediminum]|uniref:LysR family transcriptional regulator n=1 Tax=Verticiella sediminum TaxID=1247510 RepID=A0A556ATW9_9BURK|nr:LysR family transcriptional regulator [Verticiella sediminum]TSH96384.1 LysR family transcriptional regulator [Verticiella sediminum]
MPVMDLLGAIRTFVTIVEAGGLAPAAERLQISAAAVSRHLALLENHLEARLLDRTTRRHRLTEIGETCFERYSRILADIEQTQQFATAGTIEAKGVLRVASTIHFWTWRIAHVLPRFMRMHPALEIQVNLSERVVDLVEENYDLALQFHPPVNQSVVGRKITTIQRVVCASPEYLRLHGVPRTPEELTNRECLLYASRGEIVEWRFRNAEGERSVRVNGRLRSTDANTLRLAGIEGIGIIRSPLFVVEEDLRTGRLQRILSEAQSVDPDLLAVYPSRRHLPAKVRVFVDFLCEHFGQ